MPWPKICETRARYLQKGRAIKESFVCNSWDVQQWDLRGMALSCYQPLLKIFLEGGGGGRIPFILQESLEASGR